MQVRVQGQWFTPWRKRSSSESFITDFPSERYEENALFSDSVGIKCCKISIVSVVKIFKSRLKRRWYTACCLSRRVTYLFKARTIVFTSRSSFRRAIARREIFMIHHLAMKLAGELQYRDCVGAGDPIESSFPALWQTSASDEDWYWLDWQEDRNLSWITLRRCRNRWARRKRERSMWNKR